MSRRISPAQHDLFIKATIGSHIAGLVDKKLIKREITLTPEQQARRRQAQADRELREANREAY